MLKLNIHNFFYFINYKNIINKIIKKYNLFLLHRIKNLILFYNIKKIYIVYLYIYNI